MLIRAGKFLLIGILVTGIHLAISIFLVHFFHSLPWANAIAFMIAFFISYLLQSKVTFGNAYSLGKLSKYAFAAMITFTASQAVVYLCLYLSFSTRLAILLSALTPPGISFFLNYFFVFRVNKF